METRDPSSLAPPVLVLGLGNVLLGDDGAGPTLLEQIRETYSGVAEVECIDGGTQGLALLGYLANREALVILDAFSTGKAPGEVSVLNKSEILAFRASRATTAHEGNAGELLAVAELLGDLPNRVFLVGIEPERLRTELGLSSSVAAALPTALLRAGEIVEQVLNEIRDKTPCLSAHAVPSI